jgi:geranylgeranyl diphosphate synthase type II
MQQDLDSKDLKSLLARNKKLLDDVALNFLPSASDSPEIQGLYTMMRDYPSRGGKGLRGTLCLLWCELFGGSKEDALTTAAALELFQNWILIHDDVEDDSDMRRGLPSLHKKYGIELAINTGDALHGKMWELLFHNQKTLGAELTLEILSEFGTMIEATTEGQQMELTWNTKNVWHIGEKDYLLMVTKKSAWYTCISPARMGLIIASNTRHMHSTKADRIDDQEKNRLLHELVVMGTDLGIAFQIIDDVLNLTADEAKYGKEILGDIYEGKRTLMIIHLIQNLDPLARKSVVDVLSKKRADKSKDDVQFVFEKMKEYGSIDYARDLALRHSRRALSSFETIVAQNCLPNSDSFEITRRLLEYMTTRDY